jgi:PAS domain S-box-containing protein
MVDLSRLKTLTDELEIKYEKFQKEYDNLENKHKFIVENLNEGIWQIDENENTTYCNKRMAEILGYSVEEMFGKSLWDFVPKDEIDSAKENLKRRKNGISEDHEFVFSRKDGSHIICLLGTSPIISNGIYKGALAAVTDITDRKEKELICSTMAEMSFTPVAIHRNGIMIHANKYFYNESGYTPEEIIGKSAYGLFIPEESHDFVKQKVDTRTEDSYTVNLRWKDGSSHKYEIHGKNIRFNGYSDIRVVAFKQVE